MLKKGFREFSPAIIPYRQPVEALVITVSALRIRQEVDPRPSEKVLFCSEKRGQDSILFSFCSGDLETTLDEQNRVRRRMSMTRANLAGQISSC